MALLVKDGLTCSDLTIFRITGGQVGLA